MRKIGKLLSVKVEIAIVNEKDIVLIVTACIKPDINIKFLNLVDENVRLQQYKESLRFYIENTKLLNIVFCDNSNYNYDFIDEMCLARKHNKNLEILRYAGNVEKAIKQGKGYGEGEILNYIFENSKYVNGRMCIKVTGRLIVYNIDAMIKRIKSNHIYMNNNLFGQGSVDTRCYVISEQEYRKYYLQEYNAVDDENGLSIEILFAQKNKQIKEKIYNIPVYPIVKGVSGSSGICYEKEGKITQLIGLFFSICNIYNTELARKIMLRVRGDRLNK